jgi:hypothetical protein
LLRLDPYPSKKDKGFYMLQSVVYRIPFFLLLNEYA